MTTTYVKPHPAVHEIRISTNLALHPEFTTNPDKFAFSHNLDLTNDALPETSFKADHETGEKLANQQASITIGPRDAIRLFIKNAGKGYRLRSITVKPLELDHTQDQSNPLHPLHLETALAQMKSQIAPLLANPDDVDCIIPGNAKCDAVSHYSQVAIGALLKDIEVPCLHHLSHPLTGPDQGSNKKRIELHSKDGECSILFEKERWDEPVGDRVRYTEGIAVTLTLSGRTLVSQFSEFGTTKCVRGMNRLVSISVLDAICVFDKLMEQLGGIYLPVPPEWAAMGKAVTPAKTIALLARLTGIPANEIRAMDEATRHPSKSTHERLDKDVQAAASCLKPIPVASLFRSRTAPADGHVARLP